MANKKDIEKVILTALQLPTETAEELEYSLSELERLVHTAGGHVYNCFVQKKAVPIPATYIGNGKLAEIRAYLTDHPEIETIIFDNELNPRQAANIAEKLNIKVLDRTELILDIFAARAQTRESKLEVELAQIEYLMPRLTHRLPQLSRLGGGIGTRGPGETQLEMDRRKLRRRAGLLRKSIEEVRKHRELMRSSRRRRGKKVVVLVGYTNAGKSTILKKLSKKDVYTEDKLFATLDPLVRSVYLPELAIEVLFSDTVGFIRKLPHHLVDSFKSTLEEVAQADLLIHVVDLLAPNYEAQIEAVYTVLHDLEASAKPLITLFNKIDLAKPLQAEHLQEIYAPALFVSALTGQGLAELLSLVAESLK